MLYRLMQEAILMKLQGTMRVTIDGEEVFRFVSPLSNSLKGISCRKFSISGNFDENKSILDQFPFVE